ncbi:MAG: peptidoglycan-binding protein, partial [Verrucomicrobia bacterium]|nr:peptidoglycan-binding protein [Verrucomicrobiota bacterium]
MPYHNFLVVVGILGFATCLQAQQPPVLRALPAESVSPSPKPTPFIADPTQAEIPTGKSTPAPDVSFPSSPTSAPSLQGPASAITAPTEPGVARAEPVSEREVITRLQIFLDQRSFSPGKIDGKWGEFVAKALQRYQRENGLPTTGQIDPAMQRQLERIFPIYTTYQLT